MSTVDKRTGTAVVVVDVQNGVMSGAADREAVIERIAALVARARVQQVPVVWVQHSSEELPVDSETWQIVAELTPGEGEPIVHKRYGDSFEDTDLEARLAERGVGRLVVAGAQSDACVRSTIHGAFTRGYDTILVSDAHTTEDLSQWGAPAPADVIAHTNLYWQFQSAPGRTAGVATAAEVELGAQG